jgi:hypothetical protein
MADPKAPKKDGSSGTGAISLARVRSIEKSSSPEKAERGGGPVPRVPWQAERIRILGAPPWDRANARDEK